MAGKKVEIRFESPGANKVFQDFDKLTKKEQEMILQGSKVGKALEKAGEKARSGAKKGSRAFDGLSRRIMATVDVVNLMSKAIQGAQNEYRKLEEFQRAASNKQITAEAALGNFKINNAQAIARDPNLLQTVQAFATREGAPLGEGGIADVVKAITEVRSKAGEGFTLQQQLEAVRSAAKARLIDPSVDLGALASANLRTQKALGISGQKAQNVLLAFGPKAGGDVNAFVEEFGGLQGQAAAIRTIEKKQFGAAKTDFADLLALEGILSQALGESAENTSTIVKSLTSKVGGARVGKRQLKFREEGTVERILELAERVIGGEFGTGRERQQVLTSAGLKGAKGLSTLAALLENKQLLKQARTDIRAASTTDKDLLQPLFGTVSPIRQAQLTAQQFKGQAETLQLGNVRSATKQQAIEVLNEVEKATDAGFITRQFNKVRRVAIRTGFESPETALRVAEFDLEQAGLRQAREDRITKVIVDAIKQGNKDSFEIFQAVLEEINKTADTGGQ